MIRTLIQEFPVTTVTKKPTNDSYTKEEVDVLIDAACLLYASPSPRDPKTSRMPSSA